MAEIVHLTAENFDAATRGDKPVLVDFWAEWCAPCRAIAPILKDISESDKRVQVAKLDIDEHAEIGRRLGVKSIPTLILYSKGEEVQRWIGLRSKDQLVREVEPHLASASADASRTA